MGVENVLRDALFEERRIFGQGTLVLVFVTMCNDEISAIWRTADGDFALGAAADRADFFALGGAEARAFALLADRTVQSVPPGTAAKQET